MVFIGNIANLRAAQAFCDYLQSNQIMHKMQQSETGGFDVYVNENDVIYAQETFSSFSENPNQDKFLQASWLVGKPVSNNAESNLGMLKIWHSVGVFTRWIAALCTLIFLFAYFGFAREIFYALKFEWSAAEIYRLVTPAIMHLSALHLVFNLAFWWFLGAKVEKVLGTQTLIVIFVIGALISNAAQALIVSSNFAGLSGVNYALAGFVWMCHVKFKSRALFLPTNLFVFLIIWMLLGFTDWLPMSMANWAHLGGLLTGMGLTFLLVKPKTS
jgi:GlpG protein